MACLLVQKHIYKFVHSNSGSWEKVSACMLKLFAVVLVKLNVGKMYLSLGLFEHIVYKVGKISHDNNMYCTTHTVW